MYIYIRELNNHYSFIVCNYESISKPQLNLDVTYEMAIYHLRCEHNKPISSEHQRLNIYFEHHNTYTMLKQVGLMRIR